MVMGKRRRGSKSKKLTIQSALPADPPASFERVVDKIEANLDATVEELTGFVKVDAQVLASVPRGVIKDQIKDLRHSVDNLEAGSILRRNVLSKIDRLNKELNELPKVCNS